MTRARPPQRPAADTRPVRPVDPHVHRAELQYRVYVVRGTVECLLVCECGQRKKLWESAVADFHTVTTRDGE